MPDLEGISPPSHMWMVEENADPGTAGYQPVISWLGRDARTYHITSSRNEHVSGREGARINGIDWRIQQLDHLWSLCFQATFGDAVGS